MCSSDLEFFDIRHVLAFDWSGPLRNQIYSGYPDSFRTNALDALFQGVPRSRYMHNAVGLSRQSIIILQREGTIEEIAGWLREAGAEDGLVFDNGGSVFTWAWFVNGYRGGFLFSAPDFRPPSSAVLAFELDRPLRAEPPSGSVSATVL